MIDAAIKEFKTLFASPIQVISFGFKNNADISINSFKKTRNSLKICVKIFEKKIFFKVKNFYRNNIYNILASVSIIHSLEKTKNLSINTFSKFKTMEGRGDISKISLNNKKFYLIDRKSVV